MANVTGLSGVRVKGARFGTASPEWKAAKKTIIDVIKKHIGVGKYQTNAVFCTLKGNPPAGVTVSETARADFKTAMDAVKPVISKRKAGGNYLQKICSDKVTTDENPTKKSKWMITIS